MSRATHHGPWCDDGPVQDACDACQPIPHVDYEVATCPNCGLVDHTPAELNECVDSILGPDPYNQGEYNDDLPDWFWAVDLVLGRIAVLVAVGSTGYLLGHVIVAWGRLLGA